MLAVDSQLRDSCSEWQKRVVAVRIEDPRRRAAVLRRQIELLAAVESGREPLVNYFRAELGLGPRPIGTPPLPRPITARELREPPIELEIELHSAWSPKITPREATQSAFWLVCHINWLEQNLIRGSIAEAFVLGGNDDTPDRRTRNLIRRTGGIPHVRGSISVVSNCPMARSFWRTRISTEISQHSEGILAPSTVHSFLRGSAEWFEGFMRVPMMQITALGHPVALAALVILALESGEVVSANQLQRIAVKLAQCMQGRCLPITPLPIILEEGRIALEQ